MKKLIIVSTKPDGGKGGGIPSALVGYIDGFKQKNIPFEIIESHHEDKIFIVSWFFAFFEVIRLSVKYKKTAVFWFHCGPWLSILRKYTLAIPPLLLGSKTVAHIHSPTFSSYVMRNKLGKFLIKLSLKVFDDVIVLTPWWKELLVNNKLHNNISIAPNPCNYRYCEIARSFIAKQKQKQKLNSPAKIQILTMARLIKGKGVEHIIRAMVILPDKYYLIVAGEGALKVKLEQLVKSLGLVSRVSFLGWVSGAEKEKLLKKSDIFCLPSVYDSFGMVFIEAMAFNLPVVAYNWGPIQDVVTSDVGECCEVADAKSVSQKILFVSNNLTFYNNKGPQKVLNEYTPSHSALNIKKLIE